MRIPLRKIIPCLGNCVDVYGIHTMQEKKIHTMNKFPHPQNVDNVCSLLGLCGCYRSFFKNFPTLRKKYSFTETKPTYVMSFCKLKGALTNILILGILYYEVPFLLYTDASAKGLGEILM